MEFLTTNKRQKITGYNTKTLRLIILPKPGLNYVFKQDQQWLFFVWHLSFVNASMNPLTILNVTIAENKSDNVFMTLFVDIFDTYISL